VKATGKKAALGALSLATLAGCIAPGTHLVGTQSGQAKPGLYVASLASGGLCYWERRRDTSGDYLGIIANGTASSGRVFVQIAPTDKAFTSQKCGIWVPPKTASLNPNRAAAQQGSYRVPNDLLPGTYTAPGGPSCYWERVSGWSHDASTIIAQDFAEGLKTVTITKTDKGFTSEGCGNWKRIGN
jgi:hypothetical protein